MCRGIECKWWAAKQWGIRQKETTQEITKGSVVPRLWRVERVREEMKPWWRQTGGRAAGRCRGKMPIWCLHLSVNVISSVRQQMTGTGRGQVRNLTQGVSISPSAPSFTSFILTFPLIVPLLFFTTPVFFSLLVSHFDRIPCPFGLNTLLSRVAMRLLWQEDWRLKYHSALFTYKSTICQVECFCCSRWLSVLKGETPGQNWIKLYTRH